jgi:membrane protease YdiL (CAAX protease family)
MSFLQNANKGTNLVSTYILTIVLVVFAYAILGQLPMVIDLVINQKGIAEFEGEDIKSLVSFFGKNKFLTYLIIPFIFSLLAIVLSVRFLHKRPIISIFTARQSFDWKRFFTSAFIWGSVMGLFLAGMIATNDKIAWNFNPSTFFPLLLISLFLIPLQTTCEEVLFRGYLFQGIGRMYKKGWIAIIVTGLLFGLLHSANPEVGQLGQVVMIYYIGTGIFLGILSLMDDGLELSMGYHAVNNIFAALILTNDWQAFQTDALFINHSAPTFGLDNLVTIVIVQPLLLFVYSKVYKWKNWKQKLFGTISDD